MTHPTVIIAGVAYTPLAVSQDGYEVEAPDGTILALGAGFTYARPCPCCVRGLMPCCERCPGAGHDPRCVEVAGIRRERGV